MTTADQSTALASLEARRDSAFEGELNLGRIPMPAAAESVLDITELLLTGQGKEIDEASGAMTHYFNNITNNTSAAFRAVDRFGSDRNQEFEELGRHGPEVHLHLLFLCSGRRCIFLLLEGILTNDAVRQRCKL
jgi:hypothetical protein